MRSATVAKSQAERSRRYKENLSPEKLEQRKAGDRARSQKRRSRPEEIAKRASPEWKAQFNEYQKARQKRLRAESPEYLAKSKASCLKGSRKWRAEYNEKMARFKANGCLLCPEKEICCLSAHHVGEKIISIGDAPTSPWKLALLDAELLKCVCLCENCHRKVHRGILKLPEA